MITVSVEEYCHNCHEFEPDMIKSCVKSVDMSNQYSSILVTTTIECMHREKCRAIYEYIKQTSIEQENK